MTIDYSPELGKRFVTILEEWLTPEEFETVRTRNDAREPGVCHSHDFCDANEAMAQACIDVLGRHPRVIDDRPASDGEHEADNLLWNRAWDWAIDHYLSHSPTAMALEADGFPEVTAEPTVDLNDRDSLIAWHVWNDRNGCYRDADVAAEGAGLGYWTLEDLRSLYLTGAVAPTV
jgi:hypothetical protein